MIYIDAGTYNDNNSLQRRDANEFISMWKEKLDWGDMSEEILMDIGCGTGNSSTQTILAHFPNVRKVIASDGSEDMIRMAKIRNSHPKVEYFVADIQDESVHRRWFGTVSKIVSIYCLNWPKEQIQAFRNVYNLLTPLSEAALLFVLNCPIYDMYEFMKKHPKWKKITKGVPCGIPESHSKNLAASHFIQVFSDIGFDVVLCKEEMRTFSYPNDESFKGFLSSVCPLLKHIPDHLRGEFEEDFLKDGLKRCGRSSDGRPNFYFTALNVVLRKPFGSETSGIFV